MGRPDHVNRDGDTIEVGKPPKQAAQERERNATTQMDRIEAKLDRLIALLEDTIGGMD